MTDAPALDAPAAGHPSAPRRMGTRVRSADPGSLDPAALDDPPLSVKFVVGGGFGVGKTTFVGSASDVTPLRTEGHLTAAGRATDPLDLVPSKSSTTVAMDFGRLAVADDLYLYLFGLPGQARFGFMWDDIAIGALAALILVDARRLPDAFPAVDFVESRRLPFVAVLNHFDTAHRPDPEAVRYSLNLAPDVPLLDCDARSPESVRYVLLTALEIQIRRLEAQVEGGAVPRRAG